MDSFTRWTARGWLGGSSPPMVRIGPQCQAPPRAFARYSPRKRGEKNRDCSRLWLRGVGAEDARCFFEQFVGGECARDQFLFHGIEVDLIQRLPDRRKPEAQRIVGSGRKRRR